MGLSNQERFNRDIAWRDDLKKRYRLIPKYWGTHTYNFFPTNHYLRHTANHYFNTIAKSIGGHIQVFASVGIQDGGRKRHIHFIILTPKKCSIPPYALSHLWKYGDRDVQWYDDSLNGCGYVMNRDQNEPLNDITGKVYCPRIENSKCWKRKCIFKNPALIFK